MTDITRSATDGYPWYWKYGTGEVSSDGSVSCESESFEFGSNYDGAGVGFVVDVTTERGLYVDVNLHGVASSWVTSVFGYANAEPMFEVYIYGLDLATREFTNTWEVGIDLRAVAPVFGHVDLADQRRAATPNGSVSRVSRAPGRVFVGGGVKTYAGTAVGLGATADARINATVDSIRVVSLD